ncbi:putative regulator of septum formation [Actinomadura pelletieri DSM 43383]|uniref:Putative regulator of septum formation n=1 Tax=Actinomadura pelletieri DSM 43383 TaxID=1120940 RepID=A0A495QPH0_9ACTN|nr:septum formation family protein [Actinomadura pelletieri]RKS74819.1 putative regulator of septum formation [Actinomadura pelletieri DSM 43383]
MTTPPPSRDDHGDHVPRPVQPAWAAWAPPGDTGGPDPVAAAPDVPSRWPPQDVHRHGPAPPSTTVLPRTNRLAVSALVTGIFGLVPLTVLLCVAALVQAGRRGERGRGLAVGGLAAAAVWSLVAALAVAGLVGSMVTAERDASGRVIHKDKVLPAALRVGDCFTGIRGDYTIGPLTALPCAEPHDGEVVAQLRLPGKTYPGDEKTLEQATNACFKKAFRLQRSRHAKFLEPYAVTPTRTSWRSGDRRVLCLLRYTGPGALAAPLATTVDPDQRYWSEMTRGDCFGKWDPTSLAQRVVSCTTPYWNQVYGVFTLEAGPYPGTETIERKGQVRCERLLQKAFGRHPYPDQYSYFYPEKHEWDGGIRTVVCFGVSEDRPLKRPMLPS